ncbi:MAG: AAA family ATPase [Planctomycetota bacterium]|nr:MAG: AAA family ATPase [Planctomycetota bacterium]
MAPSSISPPSSETLVYLQRLKERIGTIYRGEVGAVELLLTAFFGGGHVLIEDIPGVGKTTLARALAHAIGGNFQRIQCTPDLMPADITGLSIYDESERRFVFHPGPIFCDILLADELNRTPPRTQSALLEAMSEGQVTVDGGSRQLSRNFFCVATQNPVDHVGTYPIPDSQRDRFLLCFSLGYPEREREIELLAADGAERELQELVTVMPLDTANELRQLARQVMVSDEVRSYLLELINATRSDRAISIGASPRAALGLQRAAQAAAMLAGREFVVPSDIQALAVPALAHRVSTRSGGNAEHIIKGIVERLPAPR